MRIGIQSCDLGLSRGRFGECSIDTAAEPQPRRALDGEQRVARAAAGVAMLAVSASLLRRGWARPAGAVGAWFGATHLVAAATAFNGCPEVGAVPSLLLRRDIATECGPWQWLDERLRLSC